MPRFVVIVFILAFLAACEPKPTITAAVEEKTQALASADLALNREIEAAFADKKSAVWVTGQGKVLKLLPDDTKGARHQRFLVQINPQQTLLFAHNIDLAPRIPLALNDTVDFKGEYIYNPKGGIMHWTHHDPQGKRAGGWVMHEGNTYQ